MGKKYEDQVVMAVGGHIGDMELTCGMLLAKYALGGAKIITVALTAGEKGCPPGVDVSAYRKQKVSEAEAFAAELSGKAIVLDHPDGLLPNNDEVRFELCDIIRQEKPTILITHYKSAMHKDHNATHEIVIDARFYAAIAGFERELPRHFARELLFAENWEDAVGFKPYLYIDTTEGYELWKKAVVHHEFVTKSTSFEYFEYYDALSRVRGIEARTKRAEAFMLPEEIDHVVKESL